MNRVVQFVRSLLPKDPRQLLLVIGLVCLTLAPQLRWLLSDIWTFVQSVASSGHPSDEIRRSWILLVQFVSYFLIFAASAGFFTCCWPGKRSARRIFWLVLLPAFAGLSAICFRYLSLLASPRSVLQRGTTFDHGPAWAIVQLTHLGAAFHFCIAGLLLVATFVLLLARKKTSLPISMLEQSTEAPADSDAWGGCKRLIWLFQGAPALTAIPMNLISLFWLMLPPASGELVGWRYQVLQTRWPVAEGVAFFAIAVCAMGKDNWKFIDQQIRMPTLQYMGLGLAVPAVASWLPSLLVYLHDRADWAAHSYGKFHPPVFGDYLGTPEAWMVTLFLAAFAEEVIFRGVLQRHFIERFGVWRGICFVGITWAAFHFYGDANYRLSDFGIVAALLSRVIQCVVLGFGLSWLTLRSKSLLPATIAHGLYNSVVELRSNFRFFGQHWVHLGLWALIVYALFRYWPVQTEAETQFQSTDAQIETA